MEYPKVVKAFDRKLYLIGKKGIFYWGTQETATNSDTLRTPGNVLAIAWQVTHCCLLLYERIHSLSPKDISHMSPTSQNELTSIVAKYIFQKWLFWQTKFLVYMCICIYKYVCACVYMYICVYMCICICACMCVFVRVRKYILMK